MKHIIRLSYESTEIQTDSDSVSFKITRGVDLTEITIEEKASIPKVPEYPKTVNLRFRWNAQNEDSYEGYTQKPRNKIPAIKFVRELSTMGPSTMGLGEAKALVESAVNSKWVDLPGVVHLASEAEWHNWQVSAKAVDCEIEIVKK
jgi:hypothetical protein